MRRVWKLWATLTLEWRSHSTTRLVTRWSEGILWWIAQLLLGVGWVEVIATTSASARVSATTWVSSGMIAHIALCGLGRFLSDVTCLLIDWCQSSLVARSSLPVTLIVKTAESHGSIATLAKTRRRLATAGRWRRDWRW